MQLVALHPEGVDRNLSGLELALFLPVALHPEGVDRNICMALSRYWSRRSPSTRRAWIEIAMSTTTVLPTTGSPSTRRAWIEITNSAVVTALIKVVALHPEGVDRNQQRDVLSPTIEGRPPPGGRG